MRQQIKALNLENASLLADAPKKSRRSKKALIPDEVADKKNVVMTLARMFSVMGAPWITTDSFGVPRPIGIHPFGPERYAFGATSEQGLSAELFQFIPDNLHEVMEKTTWFKETVSTFSYTVIIVAN